MHIDFWFIVLPVFTLFGLSFVLITYLLISEDSKSLPLHDQIMYSLSNFSYIDNPITPVVSESSKGDLNPVYWNSKSAVNSTLMELETEIDAEVMELFTLFAAQILIWKGFTLGQDFSANGTGKLLVSEAAAATLMRCISAQDHPLLQKVLQFELANK
ncbi:MAG: hypothetical protein HC866_07515 [Leptolyngbyaceae cyanobacterium RU_5_1]|nr:hypothetical protein [Leptolyngbyaceae cyanobacterium RU_5_1]